MTPTDRAEAEYLLAKVAYESHIAQLPGRRRAYLKSLEKLKQALAVAVKP